MSPEEPAPAVQRLLARLSPVATESVPLADAAGRVLAEPVIADRPSPAADVTAMDGYAVRLADIPGELSIAGEAAIGEAPPEFKELDDEQAVGEYFQTLLRQRYLTTIANLAARRSALRSIGER